MSGPDITIRRLRVEDAPLIVDCFKRVYGDSYANETFYDRGMLAASIEAQTLSCIGAFADDIVVGHMAMTIGDADARSAELGNTVVDPRYRGAGIAWRVGDALTELCRTRGFSGFLHYPTTDHHIMQEHSVKAGFETGLMLGYIPVETDGQVNASVSAEGLREAATVVYQPLMSPPAELTQLYCPAEFTTLLDELAESTGLPRIWLAPASASTVSDNQCTTAHFARRGLRRMTVSRCGDGFDTLLQQFITADPVPCLHLDLLMHNPHIDTACQRARQAGFAFCAWLPGYGASDVLRLQRVDPAVTQLRPLLVNPGAQRLLAVVGGA